MNQGWRTSEFKATVALCATFITIGMRDGDPRVRIASLVAAAAVVIAYSVCRTVAKRGATHAPLNRDH
jgi:hypothetical protein